jgi:hypothetical protein
MCLNESYTKVRVGKAFLIHFLLRMVRKKKIFITKAFTLSFGKCEYKGSGRSGGVEMK